MPADAPPSGIDTGRRPDDRRGRCRDDAGSSLVGIMGSVLVMLIFLLLATQLLVGLYVRSAVAGAAFDGAQYAARHPAGVEPGARRTVEGQLGAIVEDARVTRRDADYIEYTVVVAAPRFLSRGWLPGAADRISRTARARIERRR